MAHQGPLDRSSYGNYSPDDNEATIQTIKLGLLCGDRCFESMVLSGWLPLLESWVSSDESDDEAAERSVFRNAK